MDWLEQCGSIHVPVQAIERIDMAAAHFGIYVNTF